MVWFTTREQRSGASGMRTPADVMPVHEMFVLLGKMMPAWHKTPSATRRTLLTRLLYPASTLPRGNAPGVEALVAEKWLEADWKKSEIRQGKTSGPVWDILRAMESHNNFSDGAHFGPLLAAMFTSEQLDELAIKGDNGLQHQDVETSIRSRAWVGGFLAAPNKATWIKQMQLQGPLHSPMDDQRVFAQVQKLVKTCLEKAHPLPAEQAANHTDLGGRDTCYGLLGLAVEHLLLIPVLDPQTLDLLMMVEPAARASLQSFPVAKPVPVAAVTETYCHPWMMEDLVVVLTHATFNPLRVRQDGEMYMHDISDVHSTIMPLPEWLLGAVPRTLDQEMSFGSTWWRTEFALQLAQRAKLLEKQRHENQWQLALTTQGQDFLSLSAAERVRRLADMMIASQGEVGNRQNGWFVQPFGGWEWPNLQKTPLGNLRPLIAQTVGYYPAESYLPSEAFLRYHAEKDNPYIAAARDKRVRHELYFSLGFVGTPESMPEPWELYWLRGLSAALHFYIAGLGGVSFGRDDKGLVYFQVNALGRYLLGLTHEVGDDQPPTAPEKPLLVQPNFEVVFVAASPAAYVLCGQFCERSGKGSVGNLLKITKKSIFRAASAGWTVERVVESLANASSKPLPANVLHEIRGWFGGLRQVQVHPCVLITCPDAATADRVLALYAYTEPPPRMLPGHLVELSGSLRIAEITTKLNRAGIFVS